MTLGPALELPVKKSTCLEQLSCAQLRALASSAGKDVTSDDRVDLLKFNHSAVQDHSHLVWTRLFAEGVPPLRASGLLFSHNTHLYMLGGQRLQASQTEALLVRCNSQTHRWENIQARGVPADTFSAGNTGVLHNDTLFAFGTVTAQQPLEGPDVPVIPAPGVPVLYKYGMWSKLWERLPVPNSPAFSHKSLLAACGKDLLMLGKGDHVQCSEMLWTYNILEEQWQQHHATGELPSPREACALTVANGRGYLLMLPEEHDTGLDIYELDLQKWHWRRLPASPYPFMFDSTEGSDHTVATAVVKGHWMVYGGACDDIEQPDEEHSQLHVFDFKTLSWLKPPLDNAGLGYRTNHMAACHNEYLVVLGGICDEDPVEDVLCVRMEAKLYSCGVLDSQLANYEKASHQRLFTDATVTVDGRNFQLHKHVLATSSPVFERMFSSEMQEGKTGSIVIEDMSAATFELMVSYLYRTMNAYLRLDQAVDLVVASDKYGMTGLHAACTRIVTYQICRLDRHHRGEIEELYEYAATIGNDRIEEVCRRYLLTASRHVLCLEDIVKLPIRGSSEGEGTSGVPPAAAANTEEQVEQVDDIGDELDVDQLDSFWIEELQEARPQLPVPQDSLDVQEAVNSSWPDSARQSAILASKHLSSRMAEGPAPSTTGHHKHAQVGLGVDLSKGLVDSSDNSSLSSDNSSLSSDNSSLSSDNSSLSSDSGRSTNQAEELVSDVKSFGDKGGAVSSSTDVPSRTTGGLTNDSAAASTSGDSDLISEGGASTSESVCEASTNADSSSSLTSTISDGCSHGSSCTNEDSELDDGTASSNSSSSRSTGSSSINTDLAVAPHASTGVPRWCTDMDADSIKASWPDSAPQTAILASKHLSSRMAGGPAPSVRGHHKHAQVEAVGLGLISNKGLVDMSEMDKQPDRAARDSSSDRQPCRKRNFLFGRSSAEPPTSDRVGLEVSQGRSLFQKAVGAVGQLRRGCGAGGACVGRGLLRAVSYGSSASRD